MKYLHWEARSVAVSARQASETRDWLELGEGFSGAWGKWNVRSWQGVQLCKELKTTSSGWVLWCENSLSIKLLEMTLNPNKKIWVRWNKNKDMEGRNQVYVLSETEPLRKKRYLFTPLCLSRKQIRVEQTEQLEKVGSQPCKCGV